MLVAEGGKVLHHVKGDEVVQGEYVEGDMSCRGNVLIPQHAAALRKRHVSVV